MTLHYTRHERVWLKNHPEFNEAWIQDRIADDPSILGLGELDVIERERKQYGGGRLDLLLQDSDGEQRYEVEIMLGPTDASHIIRTIEYWDIERRRYPGYDHYAVIVAENITSRFLNVLSLFAGSIPLIALQMSALQVGEHVLLDFAKVLDQTSLRTDDESDAVSPPTDRRYWELRAPGTLGIVDNILEIVNEGRDSRYGLNFNKRHITITGGVGRSNFVSMNPRKSFVNVRVLVSNKDEWVARLDEAGLVATELRRRARVNLGRKELEQNAELVRELLDQAREEFEE